MSESLAGKRIVVTGGRGFLGSAVTRELVSRGADAVPLASRDYDLTEQSEVRRMIAELRPESVVHAAAAVGGIGANVANPGYFLYANALMGLMLLEESRLGGVERIVLVSTTCTYPEDAPVPLHEDAIWQGKPVGATGPYGMAKRLLHEACETYQRQYGLQSAVLLLANLYGPGDDFDESTSHVIPALIRRYVEAAESGVPSVTNWGRGDATREFLHVDDAARAIAIACERDPGCEPINIGTGTETSIRDIAGFIQRASGFTGRTHWDVSKPEGTRRRYLDVSRGADRLGFTAAIPLENGLAETVAWYEASLVPTP